MKYKKIMFMLVLAVFLLSITCVSASEIDDTLASEDTNTVELSVDNDIIEDNLQTSEENDELALTDNDETLSAKNDTDVLGDNSGTYSGLSDEIGPGGNIELKHDYYTYDTGNTISISVADSVIDGKGATINMTGSNIRAFYVNASGVTIKNLTIINANYDGHGGAIYFSSSGTVSNCNFTDNTAGDWGGAIMFVNTGTVSNCNFTNNTASGDCGAVFFYDEGTVSNCNFVDNKAAGDYSYGGAIYFSSTGTVTNCNFTNNTATYEGGAVYFVDTGNVRNCNFTNNSARYGGAVEFDETGTVSNCNFVNNTASEGGGAIRFSGTGTVSNCNFTNNTANRDGGAINMGSGTVSNCSFADNTASNNGGAVYFLNTGNVTNCNFADNSVSSNGGAVLFNTNGEVTNCNFTNNTASGDGGAVFFYDEGNVTNCNFVDNKAAGDYSYGGAVYFSSTGTVTNCNFTDNTAGGWGGAIMFVNTGTVSNCNFTNNTANRDGGAVYFLDQGTVSNCNFTGNNATTGSAIYFYSISATKTVSNSRFLNNRANAEALEITKNDNNITITFTGRINILNAIYSSNDAEVTFTNVTYWGANGIATVSATMSGSNKAIGQNITVGVVVNGKVILNEVKVTDDDGMIVLPIIAGENYYINARHDTDSYYTEAEKTISNNTKFNVNVTSQTTNNKTVNITAKSNIYSEFMPGKLLFILPNSTEISANYGSNGTWWAVHTFDDYGEYNVNASYDGLDNVTTNEGNITITKTDSTITLNNVIFDYGDSINIATVGAIAITAKINGVDVSVLDNHVIPLAGLNVGTYNLTVTTVPDEDHYSVTMNATITVNPIQTQLIGNAVTSIYNANKYIVITLKDANGNPISGVSVTVDLNGAKTYSTDKNGQVRVSIKALAPKKYSTKVTFNGNANYLKSTKTIGVTVKKATPKLTAKKKTFKKSVKIKKYTITLKYGKTALKKVKVYIKIKGKTYKATTNKKGKATFKIKKLTKKGTFKSKITFKGNKYYNKVTKKVKIKVK